MLWVRLGIRELLRNKGFALFFVANLTVGLCGFVAVQSFSRSLERHLEDNLRTILTADLVLTANSPFTRAETDLLHRVLGPDRMQARVIRFFTMVQTREATRLVQVMAVDPSYPLYGGFVLEPGIDRDAIHEGPGVFMTRDTALALGIREQETGQVQGLQKATRPARDQLLTLGNKDFSAAGFFAEDPDKALTTLELAPKLYVGIGHLADTGLLDFGSRVRYHTYLRVSPDTDVPSLSQELRQGFAALAPDQPRIRVRDSRDVSQSLSRVTGHFTGYMALVSLVALFLAGIAAAYLFRGFLGGKHREIAVLMSLGAGRSGVYIYLFTQLIFLGILAAILAIALSWLLLPVFPVLLKGLVPQGIRMGMAPVTWVTALGLGGLGSIVFCLPVLVKILSIKPLVLLRGPLAAPGVSGWWQGAAFVPGIAWFCLGAVLVAGSVTTGIIFTAGFALAFLVFAGAGWLGAIWCRHLAGTRHLVRKMAFLNLYRNIWSSLACFVTIAMGVFLICLIPQVQKGLQTEIQRPQGLKIPVFFLMDIQDNQIHDLEAFMETQPGFLGNLSPMVRGRILTVNSAPFHTRENNGKARRRHRRTEHNFSFRRDLDPSETIVQGEPLSPIPWTFGSETPFEISVALSFAQDHNLAIDDVMAFDIQGMVLEGRIKNIRKVRWNSFQPNFFLLFQQGVLDDAPKTWLGAVSQVPPDLRQPLKTNIVATFPNISIIDVTQMITTLTFIADRLSVSVRFMAWLAIAAGLVSIFSIARHQARSQAVQTNLLKVLGAGFSDIKKISLLEFGSLGFAAAFVAVLLSIGFSRAVSWYFFDSLWQLDLLYLTGILVLTTLICMATAVAAAGKILQARPMMLLKKT
ncbi:MAG: ABC transporter permease [Desulfotignum sp.]|nr:ABC transporter permease [Desulfotignum sp.]